ncbi:MAG: hypothetical protein GKS00_00835 [Alphaproteobacteria bacterium]|nr:hypothetical protein [Alphaproteobacteria bacterium]
MSALVVIARYYDNPSAEVACSVLNDAGIPCWVFDRQFAHQHVSRLFAIGGIRLMIPAAHVDEAREILNVPDDLSANHDAEDCPACGAGGSFRPASLMLGVLGFFWSELVLYRRSRRICRSCGHRWRQTCTRTLEVENPD